MPEINDVELGKQQNRFLVAQKSEILNDVIARLKVTGGKNWWHLVVDWGNGEFRVIKFGELAKQLAGSPSDKILGRLENFAIPLANTIDKFRLGTSAAMNLARQQPNSIIVVTREGAPIGILYVGSTRSAEETPDILKYFFSDSAIDSPKRDLTALETNGDTTPFGLELVTWKNVVPGDPNVSIRKKAAKKRRAKKKMAMKKSAKKRAAPKPSSRVIKKVDTDQVLFSAYYSRMVEANVRSILVMYAHLQNQKPLIQEDVKRYSDELGDKVPPPRTAEQSSQLKLGTPVTVVPECDEIEFEPISLTKKWNSTWVRFDFDFTPRKLVEQNLVVRLSIQVLGLEIAHIKCGIDIATQKIQIQPIPNERENPLAAAKFASKTSKSYSQIFVSYSRKDKKAVKAYQFGQLAVGNVLFIDTESIRSGQNWQAALAKAIDNADIFQLFWSRNSAASSNVRDEWEYALKYKCPETKCEDFIRPVYWKKPLPNPPPELGHLNFRYSPLESGIKDSKSNR